MKQSYSVLLCFLQSSMCRLTCPKTDFTMGWRLESYSDAVALSLLDLWLAAGCAGALVAGGSELRLENDPLMTLSLGSKKKSASSACLG